MRPSLEVWRGEQRIGELWLGEDGRSMGFAYYVVQQCRRYRKLG